MFYDISNSKLIVHDFGKSVYIACFETGKIIRSRDVMEAGSFQVVRLSCLGSNSFALVKS